MSGSDSHVFLEATLVGDERTSSDQPGRPRGPLLGREHVLKAEPGAALCQNPLLDLLRPPIQPSGEPAAHAFPARHRPDFNSVWEHAPQAFIWAHALKRVLNLNTGTEVCS